MSTMLPQDGQQVEAFMRSKVEPNLTQRIVFSPSAISDAVMASAVLKRAASGAAFLGRLDLLPQRHAQVVWDVQVKQEPPALIRALKPKLHLTAKVKLEKDFFLSSSLGRKTCRAW